MGRDKQDMKGGFFKSVGALVFFASLLVYLPLAFWLIGERTDVFEAERKNYEKQVALAILNEAQIFAVGDEIFGGLEILNFRLETTVFVVPSVKRVIAPLAENDFSAFDGQQLVFRRLARRRTDAAPERVLLHML